MRLIGKISLPRGSWLHPAPPAPLPAREIPAYHPSLAATIAAIRDTRNVWGEPINPIEVEAMIRRPVTPRMRRDFEKACEAAAKALRIARLADIRDKVKSVIGRELAAGELDSLPKLSDQDLHLLAATFDEV